MRIIIFASSFFMCALPSQSSMERHASQMFCGPVAEVEAMLHGFEKTHEGISGRAGDDMFAEVWTKKKTGDYVILQRLAKDNRSCVVLGGEQFKPFIKGQSL